MNSNSAPAPAGSSSYLPTSTIVLVGLMGAGKTSVGRRLASRLHLDFVDADSEIELAAGCSIEDIFELHGEAAFRDGERRVLARLLDGPIRVIATGGGAYMDADTRKAIAAKAVAVWLRADLETLLTRTARRKDRPLLKHENPRAALTRLINERYPVYAEAPIIVDADEGSIEATVDRVIIALTASAAVSAAAGEGV